MFSGHGTQQPDREGLEEDGMNECIVPGESLSLCASEHNVHNKSALWNIELSIHSL